MNKIYWDKDKITIITNQLEAAEHKHWAMQLFLSLEANLDICVSRKNLLCKCIVLHQNINHCFSTANRLHISIIIDPTSNLAYQFKKILGENEYYIFANEKCDELKKLGFLLLHNNNDNCNSNRHNNINYNSSNKNNSNKNWEAYDHFIHTLYRNFGFHENGKLYDDRIKKLLHQIENCNCDEHSISFFANKVSLSSSRLSHLFKEQVGLPLKSYIQLHQMQKAFLALVNGKSITEAAIIAGFDTPSHFAAVTKRMMGMPASISLKDSVFLKVFSL